MSSPARTEGHLGLRERKKARTRRAVQEHALRLFTEQGYEATTVEQIAEAAEISPSTFFRYFPSKEDVVARDDYDPLLAAAFLAQPESMPPLAAMRRAVRQVFDEVFAEDHETILRRVRLVWSVPALRARQLEGQVNTMAMLAGVIARRTGRAPGDLDVQVCAGAVTGAWIATVERWAGSGGAEPLPELMDRALALLEAGLPL
ncbi:TetR family transcriptional regulator [Sphaerisporangium rufum]|uniref:TetR family transcriptional regulator n=1 Tax=Sphaerisporangium rufum TaxID=1381558 RepID=A0A919R3M9_9ACTN|nr:TetR family transcriptional regulator [Sphaerisporangium rufum]GII77806.1 TetR family transcriptional regulator [Sphaerisporangium rufum]